MNILIINQPLNNRGDESAHKGLLRILSRTYPDSNITVVMSGQEDSVRQFDVNLPNVKYIKYREKLGSGAYSLYALRHHQMWLCKFHPHLTEKLAWYKWADVVVCAPGGICMGGFQNWKHLFNLMLAKYMNKPLFYYARSFGPFPVTTSSNRLFKRISLEMLHYFTFLSIRDKKTEKLAKKLGVSYISTIDSAFLDVPVVTIPKEVMNSIGKQRYVVFVPNLLIWHQSFIDKISKKNILYIYTQLVDLITRKYPRHKIVMLPQTFNYGVGKDDIWFFREIASLRPDADIYVTPDCYSSDIQQAIIRNADCMIGARYHSVVFALNNNVPFIALSYEHKISGLLESLGLQDCMIDITHAFDDNKRIKLFFNDFEKLLQSLHNNPQAKKKAKLIAMKGFTEFQKHIQMLHINP